MNSCCTKVGCVGDINEIQMVNFTAEEVDSISVEIFKSGSNFTERIDSTFRTASGRTSDDSQLIIFMPENISNDHEYKITLLSEGTGQFYILNNFEWKKETCNECFPYHPASDYYDVLVSYEFNGQKISNALPEITR